MLLVAHQAESVLAQRDLARHGATEDAEAKSVNALWIGGMPFVISQDLDGDGRRIVLVHHPPQPATEPPSALPNRSSKCLRVHQRPLPPPMGTRARAKAPHRRVHATESCNGTWPAAGACQSSRPGWRRTVYREPPSHRVPPPMAIDVYAEALKGMQRDWARHESRLATLQRERTRLMAAHGKRLSASPCSAITERPTHADLHALASHWFGSVRQRARARDEGRQRELARIERQHLLSHPTQFGRGWQSKGPR